MHQCAILRACDCLLPPGRYEPAPRITEADTSNDRQSLKRRLDQRLFMLVRPHGSSSGGGSKAAAAAAGAAWSLPQTGAIGGMPGRLAAWLAA